MSFAQPTIVSPTDRLSTSSSALVSAGRFSGVFRTPCTSQSKRTFLSSSPFSTRVAIPLRGSGGEANQAIEPTGFNVAACRGRRWAGGALPMR